MAGLAVVQQQTEQSAEEHPTRCFNRDAEAAVIGCILVEPELFPRVRQLLQATDFYDFKHAKIIAAMQDLADLEIIPEITAVGDRLKVQGFLDSVGGRTGLVDIAQAGCMPRFLDQTCEIVWNYGSQRKLKSKIYTLSEKIDTGEDQAPALADELRNFIDSEIHKETLTPWKLGQVLTNINLEERLKDEDKVGLRTRFGSLDSKTHGFKDGALVVLGGRPSMGKTMFALNMLQNIATAPDGKAKPVAFFSLEMSNEDIAERLMVRESRIDAERVKTGKLLDHEWTDWAAAQDRLDSAPFYVFDSQHGIHTLGGIRACLTRMKIDGILPAAIGVDYIQLMQGDNTGGKVTNRNYELETISRGMKRLASQLRIPIILLSQLGREVEKRPDKRPMLTDLRDCGSLEQDADLALFLYREEKYNPDTPDKGLAELNIAKQRNGQTTTVVLQYKPEHMSFWDTELTLNDLDSRKHKQPPATEKKRRGSTPAANNQGTDD